MEIDYYNPKNKIYFMFDIPEKWNNHHIMLSSTFMAISEIRDLFFSTDLSKLEDFTVIYNIHASYKLGTYIVHNDYVQYFINSDDFNVLFSIKDYNKQKLIKNKTKEYNFYDELEKFRNDANVDYNYYQREESIKEFNLKTKWNIIFKNDKPIALISEKDSWRFLNFGTIKIRIDSFEEGIEFIKENLV